jgi:hypothetical protein
MAAPGEGDITFINQLLTRYIHNKLNGWSMQHEETDLKEPETIVRLVWNRFKETYKLGIVR